MKGEFMKKISIRASQVALMCAVFTPAVFAAEVPVWSKYPARYFPPYQRTATATPTYSSPSVAVGYSVGVAGYAGQTTFGQTVSGSSIQGNATSVNTAIANAMGGRGFGVGTAGQVNWSVSGMPGMNLAGSQTFGNVNNPGTGMVNVGATGYSSTSGGFPYRPFGR
jgi:hypothetical protein